MSSPIVTNLANTFRYLPQRSIDGLLGPKYGPMVEKFMGMSPAPTDQGEVLQAPGMPDPNYHADKLAEANRSFMPQQAAPQAPDVTQMRKPLKGK
jgi:hypothetical protein